MRVLQLHMSGKEAAYSGNKVHAENAAGKEEKVI